MPILIILLLLHPLLLGLAVWGLRSKFYAVFACSLALLALYPLGIFWGGAISHEGMFAGFDFPLFGILYAPLVLISSATEWPLWALPVIGVGSIAGALMGWLFWRRYRDMRVATVLGLVAAFMATLSASELIVDSILRARASEQFGSYCNFRRNSVIGMLAGGQSTWMADAHAKLENPGSHYLWSFKKDRWVALKGCTDGACVCYRDNYGRPIRHQEQQTPSRRPESF